MALGDGDLRVRKSSVTDKIQFERLETRSGLQQRPEPPAAINVPETPAQSRVPVHDQAPVPTRECPVDLVRYRVRKLSCPQRAVPKLPERPADLHGQGLIVRSGSVAGPTPIHFRHSSRVVILAGAEVPALLDPDGEPALDMQVL